MSNVDPELDPAMSDARVEVRAEVEGLVEGMQAPGMGEAAWDQVFRNPGAIHPIEAVPGPLSSKAISSPEEMRKRLRQIVAGGGLKESVSDPDGDNEQDIIHP